jgi:HKD family nuclease
MRERHGVQLIFNGEEQSHRQGFTRMLKGAKHLDCIVAFAKTSGLDLVIEPLKSSLENGLEARFAISLDFYLTDPDLLLKLFKLGRKYPLSLYLSRSRWTFHPKIYALSYSSRSAVLIGSANLTSGGLESNYEASAFIDDRGGTLAAEISEYIDKRINEKELVQATSDCIEEYRRSHRLYHALKKMNDARFDRASSSSRGNMETLRYFLREMKSDDSEKGFQKQKLLRRKCRTEAFKRIKRLASTKRLGAQAFLAQYEQLLGMLHSGGLHRGKSSIAKYRVRFQAALAAVIQLDHPTAGEAYQLLLDHFREIPRAGVNILTEILLALDCKNFAVMNQNAVSGLGLADINDFPAKPNKENVGADDYARYCQIAGHTRDELGLGDFAELDALFNYAYWRHDTDENE